MPKPLNQYKAIFFDAGDTLITIPEARAILQTYLEERNIYRENELVQIHLDQAIEQFYYNRNWDQGEAVSPDTDRTFWVGVYINILNNLQISDHWDVNQVHQYCHELYDVFTAPEHYTLFADVMETLTQLKQSGYSLGVISNFAPTLPAILKDKGIYHFFDPLIVSTLVGLEKPDPAIFELALTQSGYKPHEVLYIGDHFKNDIWAPKQAGMDAVQILRYAHLKGDGITSLKELLVM